MKDKIFLRMYSYISQISNFREVHWEKTFVFLTMLNKLLPKRDSERVSILNSVDLDSFTIQMIGEYQLDLENEVGDLPQPVYGGSKGTVEEEKELLSEIIVKINTVFGIDLNDDDKRTFKRV